MTREKFWKPMGCACKAADAYVCAERRYLRHDDSAYTATPSDFEPCECGCHDDQEGDGLPQYIEDAEQERREAEEDQRLADGTHYLDANGSLQPKPLR